jgi:hypothetical protein
MKQRHIIEQISIKLAHSDVDPISFFEYYVEFKLSKILNEQNTLTNWFQNLGNYFKGGMSNVYKRQVDISSKFQDAKKSLEAIMQVITSFKNIDPQYSDDLLKHINSIVDTMKSTEPAITTLGDKIMTTHEQPKMTGKQRNWSPSEQINAQTVQNMPFVAKPADLIPKIQEFFVRLDVNHKTYFANLADYSAKNVPQGIAKIAQGTDDATITPFITPPVTNKAQAKNILAVLLNNYYEYKIKPLEVFGINAKRDQANFDKIKNTIASDSTLANNIKTAAASANLTITNGTPFYSRASGTFGTGIKNVADANEFAKIAAYIFKIMDIKKAMVI